MFSTRLREGAVDYHENTKSAWQLPKFNRDPRANTWIGSQKKESNFRWTQWAPCRRRGRPARSGRGRCPPTATGTPWGSSKCSSTPSTSTTSPRWCSSSKWSPHTGTAGMSRTLCKRQSESEWSFEKCIFLEWGEWIVQGDSSSRWLNFVVPPCHSNYARFGAATAEIGRLQWTKSKLTKCSRWPDGPPPKSKGMSDNNDRERIRKRLNLNKRR